jgi:hypothetical protein
VFVGISSKWNNFNSAQGRVTDDTSDRVTNDACGRVTDDTASQREEIPTRLIRRSDRPPKTFDRQYILD